MMFWSNKIYFFLSPLTLLRKKVGYSERQIAENIGLSRVNLRNLERPGQGNPTLKSLIRLVTELDRQLLVLVTPECCRSDYSTLAASYKTVRDGDESWKIHFMDLVDQFRSTLDPRLLLLPPSQELSENLTALLASIVLELSDEAKMEPPPWAQKSHYLEKPWFVSGMQSLKATALLESPLSFRRNNIFVQENILARV